jgi:hypothetical protein
MLIAETEHPLRGVQVTGEATLDAQADAIDLMRRLGERYGGDVGQDDFAGAYDANALQVVRLTPRAVRGWDHADEY